MPPPDLFVGARKGRLFPLERVFSVVMHPGRCHAKSVAEAKSDGKRGQSGRNGNRPSRLFSMICDWNEGDAEMSGGERGILLISHSHAMIRSWGVGI
jgi:hypothetical protein